MALILTGSAASATYGDPGYWLGPTKTRSAGIIGHFKGVKVENGTLIISFGWSWRTSGAITSHLFRCYGAELQVPHALGNIISTQTAYDYWIVLRAQGAHYFVLGGQQVYPEMVWTQADNTDSDFYLGVANYNAVGRIEEIHMPKQLWLPEPLASALLTTNAPLTTTDGLGHVDTGAIGAGGNGLAWSTRVGTWQVAGNYACAATLVDGRALVTIETGKADVIATLRIQSCGSGATGMCLRYIDDANYLYALHDGTNAKLIQRLAGVESTLITAAATFSAGKTLTVTLRGTAAELCYNVSRVGTGGTVDAAFSAATAYGLYATATDAQVSRFVVWAKGTANEYANLAQIG